NVPFIEKNGRKLVLVISTDHVYKMDYENLLRFHVANGADVTVTTANMGVYVFNSEVLTAATQIGTGFSDIEADLIPFLQRTNKIAIYSHEEGGGKKPLYWRHVGTLQTYYEASIDLLDYSRQMDPYDNNWPIRSAGGARVAGRTALSDVGDEPGVNSV